MAETLIIEAKAAPKGSRLMSLAKQLKSGGDLRSFQDDFTKTLEATHLQAASQVFGRTLSPEGAKMVKSAVKFHSQHAKGMAKDLRKTPEIATKPAFISRIRAYQNGIRFTYENSRLLKFKEVGAYKYVRRIQRSGIPCASCAPWQRFVPIDEMPLLGSDDCKCGCQCEYDFALELPETERVLKVSGATEKTITEALFDLIEANHNHDKLGRFASSNSRIDAVLVGNNKNRTQTKEFKKFFGDWENHPEHASKVVDKDGKPKQVFHGNSGGSFQYFDPKKLDPASLYGPGFYFTENPKVAHSYTKKGASAKKEYHLGDVILRSPTVEKDEAEKVIKLVRSIKNEKMKEFFSEYSDEEIPILISSYVKEAARAKGDVIGVSGRVLKELNYKAVDNTQRHVHASYLSIKKPFDADEDTFTVGQLGIKPSRYKEMEGSTISGKVTKDSKVMYQEAESILNHLAIGDGSYDADYDPRAAMNEVLKKLGYDGITHIGGVQTNSAIKHRVWIAFEPEQIKSVKNTGTFHRRSRNIHESVIDAAANSISEVKK